MREKVQLNEEVFEVHNFTGNTLRGKVIWIHPEGRFYVVEFTNLYGQTFRESYPLSKPSTYENKSSKAKCLALLFFA